MENDNFEWTAFLYAQECFNSSFGVKMKPAGEAFFNRLVAEYGEGEVLNAIDIVCEHYSDAVTALHKIEGVLYNRKLTKVTMFEEQVQ